MLKPIDQTVLDEIELKSPNCFFIESNEGEVLIVFNHPGKTELDKYRKEVKKNTKDAMYNLMYGCVVSPEVSILKKELEEDYQLDIVVFGMFSGKIVTPYRNHSVENLEDGVFCIKNEGEILAKFKKPGRQENKRYQRSLESGAESAHLDLMLDCVFPKEDKVRVTKLVEDNIILEGVLTNLFLNKIMEHINIRTK